MTDFTQFPDEIIKGERTWYPNPADKHGGQMFNVFNLDPYVYFVHAVLGFSGYGFSLDDDTSDIGAGGASHLQLSVTNTGGLINTNPWVIQAPYGPVKNMMLSYSGRRDQWRHHSRQPKKRQQYHTDQGHHGGTT